MQWCEVKYNFSLKVIFLQFQFLEKMMNFKIRLAMNHYTDWSKILRRALGIHDKQNCGTLFWISDYFWSYKQLSDKNIWKIKLFFNKNIKNTLKWAKLLKKKNCSTKFLQSYVSLMENCSGAERWVVHRQSFF